MLRPRQLRDYARCLPHIGISPSVFLRHSPIEWDKLETLTPVTPRQYDEAFVHFAARMPEDYAVLCGREIPVTHLGVLGDALLNAPTLLSFFETWSRFSVVADHPLLGDIQLTRDSWIWESRPRHPLSERSLRLCVESSAVGMAILADRLIGKRGVVSRIDMPFPEPKDLSIYDGVWSADVNFDAPMLRIHGARETLFDPVIFADQEVYDLCLARCAETLAERGAGMSAAGRVETMLDTSKRMPTFEEIAERLRISCRSLHRGLRAEGVGFRTLLDEARRRRAETLLSGDDASVKEVAWQLGFNDPSNFRRLFRHWTGMSVNQWKALGCAPLSVLRKQ